MKPKEQLFICIGCVTFESLHDFEENYLYKTLNLHGNLMEIERNATTL